MKLEKMVRSLVLSILKAEEKGTKPYDTTAEVVRVDGDTAWVHLSGGVEETPVRLTINAVKGDIVQVRVSGGDAWLTGNLSRPPTDDGLAREAKQSADLANLKARNAQAKADSAQAQAEENTENLAKAVVNINYDIKNLKDQVDGNVTTWFYAVDPTLENPPAVLWVTDDDKNNHLGDLYYNTETGTAWRFMFSNGVFAWGEISDAAVSKALADAAKAQDTADSKRRVFITIPTPPYDIGDLWVQGSTGDILRCATAKEEGQLYALGDWVLASKYTDDTVANQAKVLAQNAQTSADGKNKIYYGSTQPIGATIGDTWFKLSEDNAIYEYDGEAWVKQELGEDAIANLSITNAKIANGSIDNAKIANLDAGKITSGTIDVRRLNVSAIIAAGEIAVQGDLPQNVSDLNNDANYATVGDIPTNVSDLNNDANYATVGDIPTDVSDLNNDAGYATVGQLPTKVSDLTNDSGFATTTQVVDAVSGKADKSAVIKSVVSVYYRSTSSTTPTINASTSIGTSANTDNAWEYVMPQPKRDRHFFTCERYVYADNTVGFSTVRELASETYASKFVSSNDSTYIDGGRIYANSITADQINANAINIGLFHDDGTYATPSDIPTDVSELNNDAGYATTGDIPTKVSELTNDSSFATTTQVNSAKNEAINTASSDATTKANQAESNAIATASADATDKADQAEANAIATASADATSKANAAETNAVNTASADATAKANQAQANAEATASADATAKANQAEANAKKEATNYLSFDTTNGMTLGHNGLNSKVNIKGDGIRLYDENGVIGTYIRAGLAQIGQSGSGHVLIQSSGMDIYGGDGTENLAHIGYDYGEDGQGGTSQAPFYTFGTRQNNQPVGNYSVSEGFHNEASGYASHAEGNNTTASGNYSHAEGVATEANGNGSHAEGVYTKAQSAEQHVQGIYNVVDSNSTYADIVGWGSGESARKNIFALETTGNGRYKGDVYVGCNDDSTGGNKVISEAQIDIGEHSFSNLASNTATSIAVTFNKTFSSAPQVVAGLKSSLTSANTGNVAVSASNVTTTGFTLRAYNGSTAQKTIYVSWIAIGI